MTVGHDDTKWRAVAPAESGSENEQDFVVVGNYTTSQGVGGRWIPRSLSLHVEAPFCGKKVIDVLTPTYSGDLRSNGDKNADPYSKEKLEVYSLGRINMNRQGPLTKD